MKKFKKSKVIIPAIATMALTTVASVSGTVAWFTASRSQTVKATSFQVVDGASALTATVSGRVGTIPDTTDNTGKTITLAENVALTHGSYDLYQVWVVDRFDENDVAYHYANKGNETTALSGYNATPSSSAWKAGTNDETTMYYAVSFGISLTYSVDSSSPAYLFFDPTSTISSNATNDAWKGFKIALINSSESQSLVFGYDNENTHIQSAQSTYTLATAASYSDSEVYYTNKYFEEADDITSANFSDKVSSGIYTCTEADDVKTYSKVTSTTYAEGTYYYRKTSDNYSIVTSVTSSNLTNNATDEMYYTLNSSSTDTFTDYIKMATSYTYLSDGDSNNTNETEYLGTFSTQETSSTPVTITLTAVAWFEGTDSNVISDEVEENMAAAADLKFYVRSA